jgi:hypothetical protein
VLGVRRPTPAARNVSMSTSGHCIVTLKIGCTPDDTQ